MADPTPLPDDPFASGSALVDRFLDGLQLADALQEARATGPEQYVKALSVLKAGDLISLVDALVVLRINGKCAGEQRYRRIRPWRWRLRRPPWR